MKRYITKEELKKALDNFDERMIEIHEEIDEKNNEKIEYKVTLFV